MLRYPLPGDRVFPEGITEGPGASFFVGSLGDGSIYRGDVATGQVEVFLPPDGDGRLAVAGLAVDGWGQLIACDFDGGALFVFDLATRSLIARRPIPAPQPRPNDVAVLDGSAYVTDSRQPVVWRLPLGPGEAGEVELAVDLAPFGPADPAYLNGIVAHPGEPVLLVASQGEGGTLWRVDLPGRSAAPVDLGGYVYNADGMLLDGAVLYGVTNRGESQEDARFQITGARLAADWRSGVILGELTDPGWNFPTTIAKVEGKLLVVCSQIFALRSNTPPALPFQVAAADFPDWQ